MRILLPRPVGSSLLAFLLGSALSFGADPSLQLIPVAPANASAVYQPGDKITWRVEPLNDDAHVLKSATFTVKQGGAKIIAQGNLTFGPEPALITTTLSEPGTLLAEVSAPLESGTVPVKASNGAAVEPAKLAPSQPAPADFDAFWKSKIAELSAIPANPVLEKGDSGVPGVDYWKITLDNIHGTHIQGQLARPTEGGKFPAVFIPQWAGVYPLDKKWAAYKAKQGWLVLNILAHDLPIDQPKEFYTEQANTALKNYTAIGNTDRETSYFLRMFLSCYRAADYLSQRPDWNGKVFLVTGASQGGLQSFVTAALFPKVTDVIVCVPAGSDNTGYLAGRQPGWPGWKNNAKSEPEKVMETSRYFDAMNFAARVHCPTLVGMGLSDVTSPASGVFAAFNQIQAPKEIVVIPDGQHQNVNNAHAPYFKRADAWSAALVKGEPAPVEPNPAAQ
ncbi:MAG: acetylxylan esterase [Chthoniobacteraceae bacterium]